MKDSLEDNLIEFIDGTKSEITRLVMDLIKIPTINPPGQNYYEFSKLAIECLSSAGLEVDLIETPQDRLQELAPDGMNLPRYSVCGTVKGSIRRPTLLLQGHYDTVPPSKDWSKKPFEPVVEGNRVYGLGSFDMKGALAAMIIAAKAIVECCPRLRGDLTVLFTPDEEHGGQAGLAYLLKEKLVKANYAVVGEPSGISNVRIGQKGAIWGEIKTIGKAAHGSVPQYGVNAFEKLVKIATAIETRLKPELAQRRSTHQFLTEKEKSPTIMLGGIVGCSNANAATVADRCSMTFDRRVLPDEDMYDAEKEIADLLKDLMKEDHELKVELKIAERGNPFLIPSDAEILIALQTAVRVATSADPALVAGSGWTEAALLNESNIQAIVYGPGSKETYCSHAADEFVLPEHLLTIAKVYALTALKLLRPK